MSTRLLLIGDLHLRSGEHLDDVERCLGFAAELADERHVDAVLLAGDCMEGRSTAEERLALGDALRALVRDPRGLGVERPLAIVRGNHDQLGELLVYEGYEAVRVFETPDILEVSTLYGTVHVDVLCLPWPERAYLAARGLAGEAGEQAGSAALGALIRGLAATRNSSNPLVVLGHLQVNGAISSSAQPLVGRAIEAQLGDLVDLGASFVALGHVHRPQELAPGVAYIGSLTCHDFGEEDEQKRVGILTVEDDGRASVEWVPVPCRPWVTVHAAVFESTSGGFIGESLDGVKWISPPSLPNGAEWMNRANVRYTYNCDESEEHLFNHEEIRSRFASAHTLKIVPAVTRAARVRAADVASARTPAEKLAAWGVTTATEITPGIIEKLCTLEEEIHG